MCFLFILFQFQLFGQNKLGFGTMVDGLLRHDVDTVGSTELFHEIVEARHTVFLLDAREPQEYAVSHLQGSIPLGYNTINKEALGLIPKDAVVVVYCSVGKRSEDVARTLRESGYLNVRNLWGGIFDWSNKGYLMVGTDGSPTNQLHPYSALWGYWITKSRKVYEP